MRNANVVAAYLFLTKGDKVLLSQRKNTGYFDGHWSVVAGHVEVGETFVDGLLREGMEEIGITIDRSDVKMNHVQHMKSDSDDSQRVHLYFVVSNWSGEVTNMEPDTCSALAWFSVDDLPENVVPAVRSVLDCIAQGVMYSEFGW